ncbi:MAG TPA: aminotransferase class IV [Propionicimonas sp.]|nr:aminotransferase class IV [Propionicimonas sp.]
MSQRPQVLAVHGRGLLPFQTPLLSGDDLGVTRGDGCFDALRVTADPSGARAHFVTAHLERFARSAAALGIATPPVAQWRELIDEALAAWAWPGEAICKVVLTRGLESGPSEPVGYLTITAAPDFSRVRRGVSAVTLDRGYAHDAFAAAPWLLGGVKTLSYAVNVAAQRAARIAGVDEAVFRSSDALLLEGPTAGLLYARDDALWTTPVTGSGVLPSVTIAELFSVAAAQGVRTGAAFLPAGEARTCDGVWLVSAIRGVVPVLELDGVELRHFADVTSTLAAAVGFPRID